MAKGIYVGVGGIAKKVSKEYVGVGGISRKVSKGYVGVGGVARECFSGETTWKKYSVIKNGTFVSNTTNVNGNYIGKIVTESVTAEATYSSVSMYTGVSKPYYKASILCETEGYLLLTQAGLDDGSYTNHIGRYCYTFGSVNHEYYCLVYQITDITDPNNGLIKITKKITAMYKEQVNLKSRGTYIEDVTSTPDEILIRANLVEGSLEGEYAILDLNTEHTYDLYYFEKV